MNYDRGAQISRKQAVKCQSKPVIPQTEDQVRSTHRASAMAHNSDAMDVDEISSQATPVKDKAAIEQELNEK